MNLLVVVAAQLLLFLEVPAPQWDLHVSIFVLAADHEANLSARVCRDRSVRVLDSRKHLFAGFLKFGNQCKM